jgi:ribulose-phosphate 3-epimerase
MVTIHIAPSILSADFARLGDQVRETEAGGANRIHIDVMDGHFVPNLSMGPEIVRSLRPITKLPLEVHLMVQDPGKFVESFVRAGADRLIVHHEVLPDPRPLIRLVRGLGKSIGLAVNPDTNVAVLEPYLKEIDLALCMTVHPGFSGQKFIANSPERVKTLRGLIEKHNPKCELEVDGGINQETGALCVTAGANVLVAASAVFNAPEGAVAAVQALSRCGS